MLCMVKTPAADYTPDAIGWRFPKCGTHGVRTVRAVRAAPEGDGGWGLLCPGPSEGRSHVIPLREPREPGCFPPCRVCGSATTAIRLEVGERPLLDDRFTLINCGHTVAMPWRVALGF